MKIRKAVITAAARGGRLYPVADTVQKAMLPVIDTDGLYKPVIQIVAEEAFASGIEEVCIVVAPGDGERYINAFKSLRDNLLQSFANTDWAVLQAGKVDRLLGSIQFVEQAEPSGYGDAVLCARHFVGDEPFLLLLGDYIYVSAITGKRCAAQLIELAQAEQCAVSAVNPTPENQIIRYGTITGRQLPNQSGIYQIEKLIEKPSLSLAELELQTPGLRIGYYLCFFGMHVLTASVFGLLEQQAINSPGDMPLTPVLQQMAASEKYLAVEMKGKRYDLSKQNGLLSAQIALGLAGAAQAETLTTIVEALAEHRTG